MYLHKREIVPKARIMVVEDERIVSRDIQDTLKRLGYEVADTAVSGAEALAKAAASSPDLVLMDVLIEGPMDGVEVAEKIRERFGIPVVYLTALIDEETVRRAKITEPFGYILKPFVPRILDATIEMALYKHRMDTRIRENEKWLQTILTSIGEAVIVVDGKGCISFMNPVAEEKTGWKLHELAGREIVQSLTVVQGDGRETGGEPLKKSVWDEGVLIGSRNNFFLLDRQGMEIPVDISAVPMRDDRGDIAGRVIVFRDVTERKNAEIALKRERDFVSTVIDTAGALVVVLDTEGSIVRFNRACEKLTGRAIEEVRGRRFWEVFARQEAREIVREAFDSMRAAQGSLRAEQALLARDGAERTVAWSISVMFDGKGRPEYIICTGLDITERKRAEEDVLRSRDFYLTLLDEFPNFIRRTDPSGMSNYFNKAWFAFTGRPYGQEQGEGWMAAVNPDDAEKVRRDFREAFAERAQFEMIYRLRRHDGEYRWVIEYGRPFYDLDGGFAGYINSCHDITERMFQEQQLSYIATHDSLTSLPNRMLFNDRLRLAMRDALRRNNMVAVMFIDLDRFKFVNDELGHDAGDALLREASKRLGECIRGEDTIARFGGDEFTIILSDVQDAQDAARAAQRVLDIFARPFILSGREIFISASIGITLFPIDATDINSMLKNADMAMYRAKEQGRNNYQFYTFELQTKVSTRLMLENSLRFAMDRREFVLHYQPQIDTSSRRVVGVEALIRWVHPERGTISPAEFIPLAEETGMIVTIGDWVLRTACRQCREWLDKGLGPFLIAVNLSSRQFIERDLAGRISAILQDTSLPPPCLEIEITESLLLDRQEANIGQLKDINRLGVKISVDDFGTGYSALSYLKRFPIHTVKIGQTFVKDIPFNSDDTNLASAIIYLILSLNMRAVAEGVEKEEQLRYLVSKQCTIMQGYYFSRPQPVEAISRLLQDKEFSHGMPGTEDI